MHTALKSLGISQKKDFRASKSVTDKKAAYQSKLDNFIQQGYLIIYRDETGFERETIRSYGYAPIGKFCIDSYNWQAKKLTNVIDALYENMLFSLDYFEQNINGDIFYHWCKFTFIPSLKTKCVVVMDNARFHKSKRIQKLMNSHGHLILWLSSYSPDLNPFEKNGHNQSFYAKAGWRIICLNYFRI